MIISSRTILWLSSLVLALAVMYGIPRIMGPEIPVPDTFATEPEAINGFGLAQPTLESRIYPITLRLDNPSVFVKGEETTPPDQCASGVDYNMVISFISSEFKGAEFQHVLPGPAYDQLLTSFLTIPGMDFSAEGFKPAFSVIAWNVIGTEGSTRKDVFVFFFDDRKCSYSWRGSYDEARFMKEIVVDLIQKADPTWVANSGGTYRPGSYGNRPGEDAASYRIGDFVWDQFVPSMEGR